MENTTYGKYYNFASDKMFRVSFKRLDFAKTAERPDAKFFPKRALNLIQSKVWS